MLSKEAAMPSVRVCRHLPVFGASKIKNGEISRIQKACSKKSSLSRYIVHSREAFRFRAMLVSGPPPEIACQGPLTGPLSFVGFIRRYNVQASRLRCSDAC